MRRVGEIHSPGPSPRQNRDPPGEALCLDQPSRLTGGQAEGDLGQAGPGIAPAGGTDRDQRYPAGRDHGATAAAGRRFGRDQHVNRPASTRKSSGTGHGELDRRSSPPDPREPGPAVSGYTEQVPGQVASGRRRRRQLKPQSVIRIAERRGRHEPAGNLTRLEASVNGLRDDSLAGCQISGNYDHGVQTAVGAGKRRAVSGNHHHRQQAGRRGSGEQEQSAAAPAHQFTET